MPVAVIGAGVIGKTHADRALKHPDVALAAIADPAPAAEALARALGVPWFAGYGEMLSKIRPKGAIVATPNDTHADVAVRCMEEGTAVIVEKPIAGNLDDARRICDASKRSGLPALVGHQRRHNPIARRAKALIDEGRLGKLVCVTSLCTWLKDDAYFNAVWRRQAAGGPVLINLIHDIDLLRYLCGDIASVQAVTSNALRGHEVEDTAAVLLVFRCGALGTVTVSDIAVAPWNWDLAAGEVERFAKQDVDSHFLSGTEASLTLPRLELWDYRAGRGWEAPLSRERTLPHAGCPYSEQLRQFRAVLEGREPPVCSAEDAMRSLQTTLAVRTAAQLGQAVKIS